ncbi:unnamed protein product [Coregonus sp. 'balchen']|nr:unnamed protein product [Coregonus sp. 'balchen']
MRSRRTTLQSNSILPFVTWVSESLLEFYRPECELMDRGKMGIDLMLQPIITQGSEVHAKSPPLCVATPHLLFNSRRGDLKLAQLAMLLAEIDCILRNCKDLSYNIHDRVFAPLWPSTVGIDDNCQSRQPRVQNQVRNLQYNHDFLNQLRFCEAVCVRPQELELIPRVNDNNLTISHYLNLRSAYGHFIPGTD